VLFLQPPPPLPKSCSTAAARGACRCKAADDVPRVSPPLTSPLPSPIPPSTPLQNVDSYRWGLRTRRQSCDEAHAWQCNRASPNRLSSFCQVVESASAKRHNCSSGSACLLFSEGEEEQRTRVITVGLSSRSLHPVHPVHHMTVFL